MQVISSPQFLNSLSSRAFGELFHSRAQRPLDRTHGNQVDSHQELLLASSRRFRLTATRGESRGAASAWPPGAAAQPGAPGRRAETCRWPETTSLEDKTDLHPFLFECDTCAVCNHSPPQKQWLELSIRSDGIVRQVGDSLAGTSPVARLRGWVRSVEGMDVLHGTGAEEVQGVGEAFVYAASRHISRQSQSKTLPCGTSLCVIDLFKEVCSSLGKVLFTRGLPGSTAFISSKLISTAGPQDGDPGPSWCICS